MCFMLMHGLESSGIMSCPNSRKLEVRLRSSVNMLEGDTG